MALNTTAKFRLTAKERTGFEASARENGMSFSAFARRALGDAMRGVTPDTVRADLANIRRLANILDAAAERLPDETARNITAVAANLRRTVARHLS